MKLIKDKKDVFTIPNMLSAFRIIFVMLILIFIPNISIKAANTLIMASGIFMLLSFILYAQKFVSLLKKKFNQMEGL